ncbi:NAD-dependent epimerase/dehydratase family protein [Aquihabitans sp. McL0605]|uniref:NAD-dependent epimerase/dehydratase family protein n=1 Tax=Aquihabitans sp. McL0605 TaxID=3415671 RepID=UPI003CFAF26F
MVRVVVTGAASSLGRRVSALLAAHPEVDEVVGIDLRAGAGVRATDLVTGDLAVAFEGAQAVIHLASAFGPAIESAEIDAAVDVAMARRVLEAADKVAAARVVLLSSATVYGPWANNAVPLTEEAPLRPHPDLAYAVQLAEVERLAADWAADHPSATVARLRPAPVVEDGRLGWLARAFDAAGDVPTADDTPAQYLHLADLASAVVTAWSAGLDGPVNVAPAGWLTPTQRRALDPVPRIRLPEAVALKVASWRWRLGLAPTPPGILPYVRHPWVVANDRLVAAGWEETSSNEEAYVMGHEASAIEQISPQRRQELALGVAGAVAVAAAVGAGAFIRHRRRRR